MQVANTRKRVAISRSSSNGVVAGSVWETRMKMDEVKGGIKVFNADTDTSKKDEEGIRVYRRLQRNQSDGVGVEKRKRRNWKPPETVGKGEKNPILLLKAKSDLSSSAKDGEEEEEEEEEEEDEIEIGGEMKSFDDKEIDIPVAKAENVELGEDKDEVMKKIQQIHEIPILPEIEKEEIGFIDLRKKEPHLRSNSAEVEVEEEIPEKATETPKRMQNIVDLVMWRDISKSAFVFGLGTFFLVSSSYTKDLNFSLISGISYLGLFYLALIFFYKSILRRGAVEFDEGEERYIIGEEEAIWVLRYLLPYINEILLKIRALFCGDPATTMKLAVVLFAMARCGSSITTWTLAKMVFFGVFTIPKVFSSYSVQLEKYGKFWIERFRDGWESITHKKSVAAVIFVLIWNISSTVARIWAVFMLIVAFQFYKQYALEWNEEEEVEEVEVAVEEKTVTEIPQQPPSLQKQKREEDSNKAAGFTGLSPGASRRLRMQQQQQQQQQHRQVRGGPTTSSRVIGEVKVKKVK